jgi:hypothetical protein
MPPVHFNIADRRCYSMDTQTHQISRRGDYTSPTVARALGYAAAISVARRTVENADRMGDGPSYLSTASVYRWAVLLTDAHTPRERLRYFERALLTAVRYQAEVLRKENPCVRDRTSAEAEIDRCIGSGVPFAVLATLLEVAAKADTSFGERLLSATCEVADWPILTYLHRTLPFASPDVLLAVADHTERDTHSSAARGWLSSTAQTIATGHAPAPFD